MRTFEVFLNGKRLCLAGLGGQGVLNVIVNSVSGRNGECLGLNVGGLTSSTNEHVRWEEFKKLKTGDEIRIKISESPTADEPTRRFHYDPKMKRVSTKKRTNPKKKKRGSR